MSFGLKHKNIYVYCTLTYPPSFWEISCCLDSDLFTANTQSFHSSNATQTATVPGRSLRSLDLLIAGCISSHWRWETESNVAFKLFAILQMDFCFGSLLGLNIQPHWRLHSLQSHEVQLAWGCKILEPICLRVTLESRTWKSINIYCVAVWYFL